MRHPRRKATQLRGPTVRRTISLPRALDERMELLRGVNWSEVATRAFEEELRRLDLPPEEWRGRS